MAGDYLDLNVQFCLEDITNHTDQLLRTNKTIYEKVFPRESQSAEAKRVTDDFELQNLVQSAMDESLYSLGPGALERYGEKLHDIVGKKFLPQLANYLDANREMYHKPNFGINDIIYTALGVAAGLIGGAVAVDIVQQFIDMSIGYMTLVVVSGGIVGGIKGNRLGEKKDEMDTELYKHRQEFQNTIDRYARIIQSYLDHAVIESFDLTNGQQEKRRLAALQTINERTTKSM